MPATTLHWENSLSNAMAAKARAKPRRRGFVRVMTPERTLKLIEKLLEPLNQKTTERTLQRYVKAELVPPSETKSAGRGRGKITNYDDDTPAQFFASWMLLNGAAKYKKEFASAARKLALIAENDGAGGAATFTQNGTPTAEELVAIFWMVTHEKARETVAKIVEEERQ